MTQTSEPHADAQRREGLYMPLVDPIIAFFTGIKRKYYYIALFVFMSGVFISFSTFFYNKYNTVQSINDYSVHQYDIIRQHRVILADLLDMETGTRGFLLTGDARFLEPYQKARAKLYQDVKALRELTYADREERARLASWINKVDDLSDYLEGGVIFKREHPKAIISVVYYEKQKAIMDDLRQRLEGGIIANLKDLRLKASEARIRKDDLVFSIILINILVTGLLLVVAWAIFRLESEYERSREQIAEAARLHRTILEGINDGVYELNLASDELYMSPTYKAMLGYEDHEIRNLKSDAVRLIHPDDLDKSLAHTQAFIESDDKVYRNIFRMRHKNGTYLWMLSRGIGIKDRHGVMKSLMGTHTDITEQKRHEEELRELNADMETFTYITSHDMRSPLVNLKGFSRELELTIKGLEETFARNREGLSPEDQAVVEKAFTADIPEALGFIGYSVERMDTLTKAILDLARIGKFQYRFVPVDVSQILEKCLGAQAFQIGETGIEVVRNALPQVTSDPLALEQIFGNLLDNAIKYMRPGISGRIEISARETPSDYIFSISDNGRGIHPLDHKKVFEIFRRARNTGAVQGQGMGMAYVQATLRKLGGSIWLDSKLDEGTAFFVRIPKNPPYRSSADLHDADHETHAA